MPTFIKRRARTDAKKAWPLGLGYGRFYGFIGGETNQWYPELIEDNHFVEQPYQPEDGYHFSKDIVDKAITYIQDGKQSRPEKPWYLWLCPGANHAPHHAPKEYIDKYKGKFDDGYEAYRDWVLKRMIERGILPADTELTPINPRRTGRCRPRTHRPDRPRRQRPPHVPATSRASNSLHGTT